jgi:dihydrolipoamide dehydrogenase
LVAEHSILIAESEERELPNTKEFDVVILGGGPGGYTAAVRASQLGLKTALVEKEHLGGVCLNWGCIPTKSLLRNAEVVHLLTKGRTFGFSLEGFTADYAEAHRRSRSVVARQTRRIAILMKNRSIAVFQGNGSLRNAEEVEVDPTGEILRAKHMILATGAGPRPLPGVPFDGKQVIHYRNALDLTKVPSSVIVAGAGPIGMEFATLWSRYGAKVTVVEMMDRVLPLEDAEISVEAAKQFDKSGIRIMTGTRVEAAASGSGGVEVTVSRGNQKEQVSGELLFAAIGFSPNSAGLGLEEAGVRMTRGHVEVDDRMRTIVPHIYAIGDVTGKLGLAHVASAQAVIAAEAIAGRPTEPLDYPKIPRCTFAYPEVASVGLTEENARKAGYEVVTAQCPFVANGKALAMDENFGFVKIVGEAREKKILGVHMVGAHVTELIAGPATLVRAGAGFDELGHTIHPHPTLSEALMEAAHALMGHAIHL